MITTTLNRIRAHRPCEDGWVKLLAHLGKTKADYEPLPFAVIVESNDLDDAIWACRCEPQHEKVWREFAWWSATQVRHLMKDPRSTACLDVVRRHIDGAATDNELAAAGAAARAAAGAAARAAAWDAARDAAWDAARAAAGDAAGAAARAAAWAAARDAAWDAARDAAWAAAWAAAREKQKAKFLELVRGRGNR